MSVPNRDLDRLAKACSEGDLTPFDPEQRLGFTLDEGTRRALLAALAKTNYHAWFSYGESAFTLAQAIGLIAEAATGDAGIAITEQVRAAGLGKEIAIAFRGERAVHFAVRYASNLPMTPGHLWPELKPWYKVLERNRRQLDAWVAKAAGNYQNDIFVAAYGDDDQVVWFDSHGGPGADVGYALGAGANGALGLAGTSTSLQFSLGGASFNGAGDFDALAAAYDSAGHHRWSWGAGSSLADSGNGILFDAQGRVVLSAMIRDKVAFGETELISAGGADFALAVFDDAGRIVAAERFGGPADDDVQELGLADDDLYFGFSAGDGAVFAGEALATGGGRDVCIARMPLAEIGQL